jgi:integral membrane protein (TIGR01906 family)
MTDESRQYIQVMPIFFRAYFILAVPILLVLIGVRLVMTPAFLTLEYGRTGFPDDQYGFTQDERKDYALHTLQYLLKNLDIQYLETLTFDDGFPLYTEGELYHMEDVNIVTRRSFQALNAGILLTLIIGLRAWRRKKYSRALRHGLCAGSILTLGIIGVIVLLVFVAWDFFFTSFHQVFFERGTWQFAYSDTLIRLFPEQFWLDAALAIGIITIIGASIILALSWRWTISLSRSVEPILKDAALQISD